jgi:superfamily II DNA or RNA helicase
MAVCSTGSGKTVMAAGVLSNEQAASVFIAHRTELVSQASLALAREGVRHRVIGPPALGRACAAIHMDEIGISYFSPNARCAVAGVDTLVRMDPADAWFSQVRLWICDEAAHLLVENKWGKAVAMFPNARGLGFTATPVRSDGKGLGRHADGVFDEMVQGPPMRWLIDNGFLTPYRLFCPPNDIDLSDVPVTAAGDFSPDRLRRAVHKSKLVGDIVQHYLRVARGKLGMTFCVDIEAAEETAAAFNAAGVTAQLVTGKTHDQLRARYMRQFRNREILQLVSVDIMGEGVDVPAVEVVQLARPTMSVGLHMQQVGRGLRLMEGKTHALILDHAGNSLRHGLVDSHREWTLDRRERRARGTPLDVIPLRACLNPECAGVYERVLPACPYCGHMHVPAGRSSPEQVDGDLHELDPAVLARMRGEIARVDGDPAIPYGAELPVAVAVRRRHEERQASQKRLRAAIALWGGWQASLGRENPEGYKRFWFRFGTDVASAMILGSREAEALAERIENDLNINNVRELK